MPKQATKPREASPHKRIKFFLRHAGKYLRYVQMEQLSLPRGIWPTVTAALEGCQASNEALDSAVVVQHRAMSEAYWLSKVAPVLAEWMENNGHDSTDLLTFMHGARGGGGPVLASQVWPRLKVALERLSIREQQEAKPATGSLTWESVTCRRVDDHTVAITTDRTRRYSYADLGMVDNRKKLPDAKWELLQEIIDSGGSLPKVRDFEYARFTRKRQRLANVLRKKIGIDGQPFQDFGGRGKGADWKAVFRVERME